MRPGLVKRLFGAPYAEIRVPSGAIANLYAFMATCRPCDRILAFSGEMGGHVTHHAAGCAGLYGLDVHPVPCDGAAMNIDLARLREEGRVPHQQRLAQGTAGPRPRAGRARTPIAAAMARTGTIEMSQRSFRAGKKRWMTNTSPTRTHTSSSPPKLLSH